ncbi:MAG: hypothetical protein RMJ85_12250, partial [Anaerolineales bacterium]|nr:hypothetical protein [Anaerolineales bacterium]
MADVKCPSCGRTNPEALEICQFCGALLRPMRTEPLPPLRPGQLPEKKPTSELERTLPGWLRDVRRAANEPVTSPIPQPKAPQAEPPPAPQSPPSPPPSKKPDTSFDLLAGLSQAADEEEDIPDWLKNLQGESPAPKASSRAQPEEPPQTPDWLAALQAEPSPTESASAPAGDWGFSTDAATFSFEQKEESTPFASDASDWLSALEQSAAPSPTLPQQPSAFPDVQSDDATDWLASLSGLQAAAPE